MSSCFTKTYSAIPLADPHKALGEITLLLQQMIQAQVRDKQLDPIRIYEHLSTAFDYEAAFESMEENDFQLTDHCKLTLESDSLLLEGGWTENAEDHLTRFIAWVLFREFGAGDALTFSNETAWEDGSTSGCIYQVHRDGTIQTEVLKPKVEEFC